MVPRLNFYKYLLFILTIIFYLYTLLNINFNDARISSKDFTFISNYDTSFINCFYMCGIFIILYILYKLYFVINKQKDFTIREYEESEEVPIKSKICGCSLLSRNIAYILYFLSAFIPENIIMLLKFFFDKKSVKCYYIQVLIIILISFFGSFSFFVKLFDPLIRNYIVNLILFNREFYENSFINTHQNINETFIEGNNDNIRNKIKPKTAIYRNNIIVDKMNQKKSLTNDRKPSDKNNSHLTVYVSKLSQPVNDVNTISYGSESNLIDINKKKKNFEMKVFDYFEKKNNSNFNVNNIENLYSDQNNSSEIDSNNDSKYCNNKSTNTEDKLTNFENYNYDKHIFEEQKTNSPNLDKSIKSFLTKDSKNSANINLNKTINHNNSFQDGLVILNKNYVSANKEKFHKSFNNKNKINNPKSTHNVRSNSIKNNKNKLNEQNKRQTCRSLSKTNNIFNSEISSFASYNYHREVNDNLLSMIAISISVNDCRIYDNLDVYKKYYQSTIPWQNKKFYEETTKIKEYTKVNIPSWIGIKNDTRFNNINFKIISYCPFVFHHIRLMDKISIDDIIASLDPIKNMQKIKESKVLGGRGNNSLFYTWDKKLILKTIDSKEKNLFFNKMIVDFHCFMRESRSILSRIYGLFEIIFLNKGSVYFIVQRNMDDLPLETKLLTFDFKGSTVNRQIILKEDKALSREKLWKKYKTEVLKDKDLDLVGLKFILDFNNWKKIISTIDCDSSFLQNLEITDYSLIVFIHKYRKEDLEKNKGCNRIIESKNKKYIFNFSIVDYLGTYNLMKKGEKFTKNLIGYFQNDKDTNFSVSDPINYGIRFRNFIKKIIIDE